MPLEAEQQLIAETKQWLESKADGSPAYRLYLDHWGDWPNPWARRPDLDKMLDNQPGLSYIFNARMFGATASSTAF